MTDDFKDEIRKRASQQPPAGLEEYINQIGSVNMTSEFEDATVYDFFLGGDDTPAFERLNDGEFGGSVVVKDGMVVKATVRVGQLDLYRGESDVFLIQVRLEELLDMVDLPDSFDIDLGDYDQGVPHLRFRPDDHEQLTVDEFGSIMVEAVELIRSNMDGLQEIADGEKFGRL